MGVELPTPTHVEYRQVLVVVAHLMGGLLEHDEHKSGPKYFCEGTLKIPGELGVDQHDQPEAGGTQFLNKVP